jgi:hypothetical protein
MAVIIRNTFLEIEKPSCDERRCRSTPPERRKPTTRVFLSLALNDASTEASPRSIGSLCTSDCPTLLSSGESLAIADPANSTEDMGLLCSECTNSFPPSKEEALRTELALDALASDACAQLQSLLPSAAIQCKRTEGGDSKRVLISAELLSDALATSKPYDVLQNLKKTLQSCVDTMGNAGILSTRVQKEDVGYSLRCSVACVPDGARNKMCWDMFRKGSCPRRQLCRWSHPEASDIVKLKVVIRQRGPKELDYGAGIVTVSEAQVPEAQVSC